MTALAEVLEAIHTSHQRFRSVLAAGVFKERTWDMWWAGPKHVRTEEDCDDGTRVIVQAGDRWWIREPNGEGHTNGGDPNHTVGFGPGPELLRPRPLLGSTVLEYLRMATIAGRRAAVLQARPRVDGGNRRWWGSGDPFEVAIDLERGIVLRADGIEMTKVAFDKDLEAAVFASPLAPGRPVESSALPRELPIEKALAIVGFPVRVPRSLPEGARLTRCLVAPNDPPGWIGLSWTFDPGGRYRLSIRQGPDVAEQAHRSGGRIVTRDAIAFHVEEYRGLGFRTENVVVELEGAWFEISSDLPLEWILDIAMSIREGS